MPNSPEQEPSIEEILASIRQIISDDDEEAKPASAPAPKAAPPPPPPEPEDDDILELTDKVDEEPEPEPPSPPPVRERVQVDLRDADEEGDDSSILTQHAASAAFEGFSKLTSRTPIDREGTGMITLEDIVRELMRPMLREWLDTHLPPIIEKAVTKELDKIARKAMEE
jgi:cell pole-organizing protein PopZ